MGAAPPPLSVSPPPNPQCVPAPSQSAMQFRLRLWRKRDWMERVCGESNQHYIPRQARLALSPAPVGAMSPSPSPCGVTRPITWGMVFIRLYLCTSSSFEGIRCCPFPIPAEKRGVTPSRLPWADVGTHATDTDGHSGCSRPAAKPWEPPKKWVQQLLDLRKCWGFNSPAHRKALTWR